MRRLIRLEALLLLRGIAVPAGLAALLLAGLFAVWHGRDVIDRQREAIRESPHRQQDEQARILAPLPRSANAGDQFFSLFFHTVREPSAWAPLAIGQRDVQPFNLKIRILALQGQLYDAELSNPLIASFGSFDFAFVVVVLAPLLVIAVAYNVRSDDEESGTWSLIRSQSVPVGRVLGLRYGLRALVVWLPLALVQGAATLWLGLPLDGTWLAVAGAVFAYVCFWVAAAAAVGALRRSSDVNVLTLLGVWVTLTALGPALVNVAGAARYPLPEALELTVQQRQAYHGAWDEPLPVVMETFYARYPEWRSAPVPQDRFSNAWYYAMQERGDAAAREAAARYRAGLEARDGWTRRWAWLFPPAALQGLLSRLARTDLQAYLAYLDSVAAYHETLKRHFFPAIFAEATVGDVDWASAPRHRHQD